MTSSLLGSCSNQYAFCTVGNKAERGRLSLTRLPIVESQDTELHSVLWGF